MIGPVAQFTRFVTGCVALLLAGCAPADDQLPPIELPAGFAATVFHPALGSTRHIAVRGNGDVYVARRFQLQRRMFGQQAAYGSLLAIRDEDGDGTADVVEEFGPTDVTTEVRIHEDWLYFSSDLAVYRMKLDENLVPAGTPEPIAGGFPMQSTHASKSIAIDNDGNLYVNSGTPSNACEEKRMTRNAKGFNPCPQLERSGGVWKFRADQLLQDQLRDGERFATGTRNIVALAWNPWAKKVFFVMHGRDSLGLLYPDRFTKEDNRDLPAEEFHAAEQGDDFGWPYTYYDSIKGKRMQAPEYGGDGKTEAAGNYKAPLIGFPAHWAPNDLMFHSGNNLPEKYAQGAFIAFHGSWNRMPFEQDGYKIVFVPMRDGRITGDWEVFVDGFMGPDPIKNPGEAAYRPTGLAEGPDGAIYITEDKRGRIWKVTWAGS